MSSGQYIGYFAIKSGGGKGRGRCFPPSDRGKAARLVEQPVAVAVIAPDPNRQIR